MVKLKQISKYWKKKATLQVRIVGWNWKTRPIIIDCQIHHKKNSRVMVDLGADVNILPKII